MPSHTIAPTGALTGLTNTEPKPIVTYGVYQQQGQTPQNVENLQNVYGTAAMPSFQFVKMIQTGERTYDPNDSVQKDLLDQLSKAERRLKREKKLKEKAKISEQKISN